MTQQEIVKDFIGVECIIESVRGSRRSEESARAHINLSIAITDQNRDLIAELMQQIKNRCFAGFGFLQAPLDFGADPAVVPGVRNANGEAFAPHAFKASAVDPLKCDFCEAGESHEIHKSYQVSLQDSRRPVADEDRDEAEAALAGKAPA